MIRRLLLFQLLFFIAMEGISQAGNDSLIAVLVKEIGRKEVYENRKQEMIEKLMEELADINQLSEAAQFELYNDLYHAYKTFIYDSAFKYSQKLIETSYRLNDKTKIGYARIKLGFILISSGMFKETFDSLKVVEVRYLPDSSRVDYYRLLARAYSDLMVYNKDAFYREHYKQLDRNYMDSALQWCKPGSYFHYYLLAVTNLHEGKHREVIHTVQELLQRHTLTDPQLAMNYYDLGAAYLALDEPDKTIRYTVLSSLSDIRASTKETAAMYTLAR